MNQKTNHGFVRSEALSDWKAKFPIGDRVKYLSVVWTITANEAFCHRSEDGVEHYVRDLVLERVDHYLLQHDRVRMISMEQAEKLVTRHEDEPA